MVAFALELLKLATNSWGATLVPHVSAKLAAVRRFLGSTCAIASAQETI